MAPGAGRSAAVRERLEAHWTQQPRGLQGPAWRVERLV